MGEYLKLFVWDNVLCDAGCGMMLALASNIEAARESIVREMTELTGPPKWGVQPVSLEKYHAYRRGGTVDVHSHTLAAFEELNADPMIVVDEKGFLVYGGG